MKANTDGRFFNLASKSSLPHNQLLFSAKFPAVQTTFYSRVLLDHKIIANVLQKVQECKQLGYFFVICDINKHL